MQLFFAFSWRRGPILMAAQWTIAEWLLGHLLTGFPWVLVGYTWLWPVSVLQIAAYGGIYSLGFFTVLLGALLGEVWIAIKKHRSYKKPLIAACLLFCIACGLGTLRLRYVLYEEQSNPIILRLVQGNISQEIKWKPPLRAHHLETYLDLSRASSEILPQIIIWPEAALPFLFESGSNLSRFLGQCLAPSQMLLMGALRREKKEVRNCFVALDAKGRLMAQYDKVRLLPFGDYTPFAKFLPIRRIAQGLGLADASPGTGIWYRVDTPIFKADCTATADFPLAPTGIPKFKASICYEIVFPRDFSFFYKRAEWLLNITNDAWFGRSSELYQHAHICRFRAIEEGAPLVHVTNTGKTCVFTALGEEVASLPLHTTAYKDCLLPAHTKYSTFFSYLGSFPFILAYCILSFFLRRTSNKTKS
jgi:apolipoprotein N-acyltransferase